MSAEISKLRSIPNMRRCMYVGGLKLPVATSTTPPRLPPSLPLPHQRIRGSDDRRAHPSRDRNRTRQDFSYMFGPAESFSRGRDTSTPTSSIAGERRAGGSRRAACPARCCGVGENLSPRRCRWAELLRGWAFMDQGLLITECNGPLRKRNGMRPILLLGGGGGGKRRTRRRNGERSHHRLS